MKLGLLDEGSREIMEHISKEALFAKKNV